MRWPIDWRFGRTPNDSFEMRHVLVKFFRLSIVEITRSVIDKTCRKDAIFLCDICNISDICDMS